MLRNVVIAVSAILTCVGIGLIASGVYTPGWQALVTGVIVLIGTLFERWRANARTFFFWMYKCRNWMGLK